MSQLSEAETLRKAAADRLQQAENQQAERDKAAVAAIQSLSEARETPRPRRGAARPPPTSGAARSRRACRRR